MGILEIKIIKDIDALDMLVLVMLGFVILIVIAITFGETLNSNFIDFNSSSITSGASIGLYQSGLFGKCINQAQIQSGTYLKGGFLYSSEQVTYTPLPPNKLNYYINEYNNQFNKSLLAC